MSSRFTWKYPYFAVDRFFSLKAGGPISLYVIEASNQDIRFDIRPRFLYGSTAYHFF